MLLQTNTEKTLLLNLIYLENTDLLLAIITSHLFNDILCSNLMFENIVNCYTVLFYMLNKHLFSSQREGILHFKIYTFKVPYTHYEYVTQHH
jgi:hypothetical protein